MTVDRPLRFCMITTFYPPYSFGGDGIYVRHLANALAQRGHHVDVIHCLDSYRLLARCDPAAAYDDHPNVTVHGLHHPLGFLSPLATQQTGRPWFKSGPIRHVLEQGFDVIHYHNVSLVGGPQILAYGAGIKLYSMHEYWLVCPTHVLFKFNRAACDRPSCLACSLVNRRPPQGWRYLGLLRAALRHVDAFLAPSRFCRDQHRQRGLDVPIVHLPLFAPAVVAPEEPSSAVTEPPYFLFVGRLEKLKGLQTLIPVFQRYRKARLLVAGTGHCEAHLRQLAAGHENIEFLGHVSGPQLHALYAGATAVIVPSICFEAFPMVLVEAARARTPAIVRNLGGLPEAINESGGGLIYETEDELLAALDRVLANPSCRRELGAQAYDTYQRIWTVEAHLERYFSLIAEIAARRGIHLGGADGERA
jgi:glycosyltransferase involved in cell wall biosynthesis